MTRSFGGHSQDALTVITGVILGGTSLYGGYGDDLLQADDNLDSTKVTTLWGQPVTVESYCALADAYNADIDGTAREFGILPTRLEAWASTQRG